MVPPRFTHTSRCAPRWVRSHPDHGNGGQPGSAYWTFPPFSARLGGHLPRGLVHRLPPSRLADAVAPRVLSSSSPVSTSSPGVEKTSTCVEERPNCTHLADASAGIGTKRRLRRLPGFLGPSPSTSLDEHRLYSLVAVNHNDGTNSCQVTPRLCVSQGCVRVLGSSCLVVACSVDAARGSSRRALPGLSLSHGPAAHG